MKALKKPKYRDLQLSECAGAPILRTLWERFDISLLLTQSGMMKRSGTPSWLLCFLYVVGLISNCSSVVQMADLAQKDSLLKVMFKPWKLAQYTMSRFFTTSFPWKTFGKKRIERLQQDGQTRLKEGDVINLDDTHCAHPYAKQLPFLSWLFDHSTKTYSWAMNLVVIQAVLQSGLEYPLFYSIWHKPETKGEGLTKLDLAKQMLLMLRESVKCRLWVAMDRWYLCKDFFVFLESNQFDWVTKAKRNTALFRREIEPLTRRERYVPLTPNMLIREVFKKLTSHRTSGLVSIAIPDIYMKQPYTVTNRKGKQVTKQRYVQIAAVAAMRLKEDELSIHVESTEDDESPATYRGAYLLISNRYDAPKEATQTYVKRWRIEVFFRTAKQELAFEKCHSESEAHHHAHFELLFTAETLLGVALFEMNKEKTSGDEGCTHGEMVRSLFHTRCQTRKRTYKGHERIYVDFDIEVKRFARLIRLFWPQHYLMLLWVTPKPQNYQVLPRGA
ncbi:transposase [Paenibacillus hexagrammi]|uniref:Transposase n=1 Tax=Paenibacillus hexagrammi TaxID=2908839 RepID=A0ABY3SCP9_9BACL|nr:transposase [Paenibacillus sp. YPD9-1]UJF31721.1 transposase [Paenibacillus sp. YPD9-1]UJF34162.1 transposase [Paenibacillus sp. YPD9-1]UJF34753.1 transposase [Paenibacillus sp. YPD9-1]